MTSYSNWFLNIIIICIIYQAIRFIIYRIYYKRLPCQICVFKCDCGYLDDMEKADKQD